MAVDPKYIDYVKLAEAQQYYEAHGFPYMEVPWIVSNEAVNKTLPSDREATMTQRGPLVGSAEQSFIELLMRGEEITKASAITPCFRDEYSYDELHHAYFMKLELIDTQASPERLQAMIKTAQTFLSRYIETKVIETGPDTYDIVDAKQEIELGSYGFRQLDHRRFIYGTGLALPRLDTALILTYGQNSK